MSDDEDVGYGKPPKASRFKKGQSGNPAGRPKVSKSAISVLEAPVMMIVGGKKRQVSAFEASLRKTAQSAIEGNLPPIKRFFRHCDQAGLLLDPNPRSKGGVWHMPIDIADYPDRVFTDAQLAEIERINAGLNKPLVRDPPSEKEAVIRRVANERHLVPGAGRKMTIFEIVQHKLRHRAMVERDEPCHAFFEKLVAQTTPDYDAPNVGYLVTPAAVPMWLTPLDIEDVDTGETVKVPSPGEPGFDPDNPYGFGRRQKATRHLPQAELGVP
jgi:hypothetical protein